MRETTIDALWCARAAFWLGLVLVTFGFVLAGQKAPGYFSLAAWIPGSMALAGSAIIRIWTWKADRDHNARAWERDKAADQLRGSQHSRMWIDGKEIPVTRVDFDRFPGAKISPELLEQQKRMTMDEIMMAIRGQWKKREDETDG